MQKFSALLNIFIFTTFIILTGGRTFAAEERFGFEIKMVRGEPFAVVLETGGNSFVMMSSVLRVGGFLAYFAAQDFTHGKEMIMHEFKEIEVVKDEEDVKGIKTVISLQDLDGRVLPDYKLVVSLQINRGCPSLVVYSKLVYKGREPARIALNWGITGDFRYYVYPKGDEIRARRLEVAKIMRGRATKLGRGAYPWIWPTNGRGDGLGIMTVGMLLNNPLEREIVITDAPPKKKLNRGEFMDIPFILLPTTKEEGGVKPVRKLYERIRGIRWKMADW